MRLLCLFSFALFVDSEPDVYGYAAEREWMGTLVVELDENGLATLVVDGSLDDIGVARRLRDCGAAGLLVVGRDPEKGESAAA